MTVPTPHDHDTPTTEQVVAERTELIEQALLLAGAARLIGKARDEIKRQLLPYLTRGTLRPEVDGMDAGTVTVPKPVRKVVCHDRAAFLAWLLERHPSEVEQVCRDAYWGQFTVSGDGSMVIAPDGEVDIPGLIVEIGNTSATITPSKDAAVMAALWARHSTVVAQIMPGSPR